MTASEENEEQLTQRAIVNSSAYGFCVFRASELPEIKARLLKCAAAWNDSADEQQLRGTILLSVEGVNVRLSGTRAAVDAVQRELRRLHADLRTMEFKDSLSERLTLPRMLVKVKKEVISMGVDDVKPAEDGLAAHVSAEEFKKWLDEEKDMVVLDTRNDYEVRLGTFDKAVDLELKSFRAFPSKVREQLAAVPKDKPIVMFCTGGVRCEKASHVLLRDGHREVYQLDGGILKYFERVGGAHYRGECYIFDDRVSLTPALAQGAAVTCFVCRSPLSTADQRSPDYIPEKQCAYCKHDKSDFRHAQ